MKLNIGLMTCFVDNYGACLQAYALQQTIKKSGNDVEIIKYIGEQGYEPDRGWKKWIRNPLFRWIRRRTNLSYEFYCERRGAFDAFRNRYLEFSSQSFHSFAELQKKANIYDAYVCGSDQIWNPNLYHGNNHCYYLDFVEPGKKRIAYAPSIGISSIPVEYQRDMKELLNRMDVLSTRERTGAEIVTELSGRECRTVLDPTLLLSKEEWSSVARKPDVNVPYVFCYVFGDQEYIGKFIHMVKEKTNLPILTIPFSAREQKPELEEVTGAGPEDFVGLIKNASLVITDSFHATAFSINLNTPFYTMLRNGEGDRNNMNSRVLDILHDLGLQDRIISGEKDFPDKLDMDLSFENSNSILFRRRKEDIQFLFDAINR